MTLYPSSANDDAILQLLLLHHNDTIVTSHYNSTAFCAKSLIHFIFITETIEVILKLKKKKKEKIMFYFKRFHFKKSSHLKLTFFHIMRGSLVYLC